MSEIVAELKFKYPQARMNGDSCAFSGKRYNSAGKKFQALQESGGRRGLSAGQPTLTLFPTSLSIAAKSMCRLTDAYSSPNKLKVSL
jgi:hypothetical protein